ncbi:DNA methyltransferase [Archangium lansingense]|uniref:DNA methyltransferase n=1 Tax=Archangium lansingense TaxID=2995310 RepID=A0ABT4AJT2_9BACT|nr:DNA methyltransferase [Archangium lansinium]MCY1081129.1 DNA methyltransferase [Archangium lansinium]
MPPNDTAEFRGAGVLVLGAPDKRMKVLPAPFVRNGPPDQAAFHRRLLELQSESPLPLASLGHRLSMVEEVEAVGQPSQHRLEKPRPISVSWNSNYGSHGWHRYVGRFPPHVVRALLNHFGADSRSVVCDPFAGSGTTAVECRLLGIPFVGIEICPLSAMMTRAKAAFPSDSKLLLTLAQCFVAHYDAAWKAFVGNRNIAKISHAEVLERKGNQIPPFANVERWFTREALLGTSIAVEFGMQQQGFAREAVLLAISAKMRSIGNVDVDVVRAEYSKTPRRNVNVGKLVARQLMKMAGDISASLATHEGLISSGSDITVHEGSVLDVELGEGSIHHIITSPPYGIEAISYLRTHLLSYRSLVAHLGHDPYDARNKTIGSEYLTDIESDAGRRARERSKAFRAFFEKNPQGDDAKYEQRRAAMMQFCDDMLSVGERMARWLKRGGQVAFVIGNKRLGDEILPMDTIVTELFATCGLEPVDAIRHKLKTNNSNSQVPWQERIIQEESILLFKRTT